jgi:hypothetical protein
MTHPIRKIVLVGLVLVVAAGVTTHRITKAELVLVALVLVVLAVVGRMLRRVIRQHGVIALVWRWFSGHTWHGRYYTDSGWFRHGVRVLHPTGHASRWHHLPRAQRAAIRTGATFGVVAELYGLLAARELTITLTLAVAGLGLCWASWRGVAAVRNWRHVHRWVRPLHDALAPRLGIPAATRPQEWLSVPRGFTTRDNSEIALRLPRDFHASPEARNLIGTIVGNKLALEDISVRFEMPGIPRALITTSAPPPARVGFREMQPLMEAAAETRPVMGIGRSRAAITADLDADSPHILISAGSGGGKSVLARTMTAQGLHNGDVALVLDIKRISHRWAKGLPNVRYCRTIEEIHDALVSLIPEIDRRNELVDTLSNEDGELPDDVNIGPRFWLLAEEMNATANRLAAYWRKIKAKDDPALSPAIDALNDFLFMGRALKMNAIGIAQMFTARTLGGPEARENFATRCLTRYTVNAWRMLVPEVWPMPSKSRHIGRWQIVTAGTAHETQVGYLTPGEAREWALSGVVTPFPDLTGAAESRGVPVASLSGSQTAGLDDQGNKTVSLTVIRGERLVGLREAVDSGVVSISLAAVRRARADDPEFPAERDTQGLEKLYSVDDLTRWESNRERGSGKKAVNE